MAAAAQAWPPARSSAQHPGPHWSKLIVPPSPPTVTPFCDRCLFSREAFGTLPGSHSTGPSCVCEEKRVTVFLRRVVEAAREPGHCGSTPSWPSGRGLPGSACTMGSSLAGSKVPSSPLGRGLSGSACTVGGSLAGSEVPLGMGCGVALAGFTWVACVWKGTGLSEAARCSWEGLCGCRLQCRPLLGTFQPLSPCVLHAQSPPGRRLCLLHFSLATGMSGRVSSCGYHQRP